MSAGGYPIKALRYAGFERKIEQIDDGSRILYGLDQLVIERPRLVEPKRARADQAGSHLASTIVHAARAAGGWRRQ